MKNRKLLLSLSALAVIALLLVVLEKTHVINWFHSGSPLTPQSPTSQQKQQEAAANADSKKQVIESTPGTNNSTSGKSIELTAQQASNNTVTVFTSLPGYSDGTCDLIVSNAGKTTTQSAKVIYQQQASTCAGFSVPIDSVGKGTWNLKLSVTSNGITDSKTITYEVK
ncbi:MAG TPA: hypothetical protein VLE74_04335 [Candidatus Saccharimonadales bacterium]|nr:hypothetical protein [Candidatus Saccharimonadales bacterium]